MSVNSYLTQGRWVNAFGNILYIWMEQILVYLVKKINSVIFVNWFQCINFKSLKTLNFFNVISFFPLNLFYNMKMTSDLLSYWFFTKKIKILYQKCYGPLIMLSALNLNVIIVTTLVHLKQVSSQSLGQQSHTWDKQPCTHTLTP